MMMHHTDSEGFKDRVHLLDHNRGRVEMALRDVVMKSGGIPADYVAFLVDASTGKGRDLAVAQLGEEPVRDLIADHRRRGLIPTLTLVLPRDFAIRLAAAMTPNGGRTLSQDPRRVLGFEQPQAAWVVVVASAGNAYATVDVTEGGA